MPAPVRFEQAVYGSFPFRSTGYGLLAASPGCRAEWIAEFEALCRLVGEKPPGSGDLGGMLLSARIGWRGPWMIVGVSSPGADDRGRPDALAFHGLFVEGREFRKIGYDPFALAPSLRSDWGPATTLGAETIAPAPAGAEDDADGRASELAAQLRLGKVAMASPAPIFGLARDAWRRLPRAARRRKSVATWTFSRGVVFDLVAAPSLARWDPEPYSGGGWNWRNSAGDERVFLPDPGESLHAAGFLDASEPNPPDPAGDAPEGWGLASPREAPPKAAAKIPAADDGRTAPSGREWPARLVASVALATVVAGSAVAWRLWPSPPDTAASYSGDAPARSAGAMSGPDRAAYADVALSPDDRLAVLDRLKTLATTVPLPGGSGAEDRDAPDRATSLMERIAQARYRGPLLSDGDLAAIARDAGPGRSRALEADRIVRRFVADRPLPRGFASGPLRWRIDTLAWSFHVEPDPRLTPVEAVEALADALTLGEPVRPNPLEGRYPALAAYAEFLRKLPAR